MGPDPMRFVLTRRAKKLKNWGFSEKIFQTQTKDG